MRNYVEFQEMQILGFIIHRRLVIDNTMVKLLINNNVCDECTILLRGGNENPSFSLGPFRTHHVGAYIKRANLTLFLLYCAENNEV